MCTALALAALLLWQTPPPTETHQETAPRVEPVRPLAEATARDQAQGQSVFEAHCASCHGLTGEGARGPTLAVPTLFRAKDDSELVTVIRRGLPGTEMPSSRLEHQEIWQVAAFVRALGQVKPETLPGDAQRGESLYRGRGNCTACHSLRGRGGALGPDLTGIGLRRGASYLRRSLTEPSADLPRTRSSGERIPDNFLQVRAVTREGRKIAGVRVNEDTFTIQIRDQASRLHSLDKASLRALHKDWGKSSMPAYGALLAAPELEDLVAFLAALREP